MPSYRTRINALDYHRQYPPGKLEIKATKPMSNSSDLSLAYSPGVAEACLEIVAKPEEVFTLTGRANQVAVITNGTAVLGLGNIGPEAAKPVMEGKAVLFKKFAGINGFDIELRELDVDRFCQIVKALEPTYGGINLEDIKAPECFEIEERLIKEMAIPVFHDDQHGTAIISTAGLINAVSLIDKKIEEIRVVCNGAGAAGLSILDMFIGLGVKQENILLCDSKGVVSTHRQDLNRYKVRFATDTNKTTLAEAMVDADVFIGVSVAGALTKEMLLTMNRDPIVFALANPTPEIMPDIAKEARSDVIIATGRSDYPNQINNVLCFPFLFRGALDVGATCINQEMKMACAHALSQLTKKEIDESARSAYADENLQFGREMIIPKPFDNRLIEEISSAVAVAAMESGVAMRPLESVDEYKNQLRRFVNPTSLIMQNVLKIHQSKPLRKVIFADGEEDKVLQVAQMLVNDRVAKPVLIGRKRVIEIYIKRLRLRLQIDQDVEIVDPEDDSRYREYHQKYHEIMARNGVSPAMAKAVMRTDTTAIGSMLLKLEDYDSLLCGLNTSFENSLKQVTKVIGIREGVNQISAVNIVLFDNEPIFITDTRVAKNPDIEQVVEIARLGCEVVEEFGLQPKVAMIADSFFGSSDTEEAKKMRYAMRLFAERYPEIPVEGEMTPDLALNEELRNQVLPTNRLEGNANLLVMPNLETASIAYRMTRSTVRDGFTIGPIFVGTNKPVSILSKAYTIRNIYNLAIVSLNQ